MSAIKATSLYFPSCYLSYRQTPRTSAPYWTCCVTPSTYGRLSVFGACLRLTQDLERTKTIGEGLFGSR